MPLALACKPSLGRTAFKCRTRSLRSLVHSQPPRFVTRASADDQQQGFDSEEFQRKATAAVENATSYVKEKWESTEDKPAVVIVGGVAVVSLVILNSIADAVAKIPVVNGLVELIGVIVTAWFAYQYLFNGANRQELLDNANSVLDKVLKGEK